MSEQKERAAAAVHCAYDRMVPLGELRKNPRNPNTHPPEQIRLLGKIIRDRGWRAPISVSNQSGYIVRGHGRLAAAELLGETQAPVDFQDYASPDDELADLLADNLVADFSTLDAFYLENIRQELASHDFDLELAGLLADADAALEQLGQEEDEQAIDEARTRLADQFLVPPFSILDARQGYWQERKRAWLTLGIRSSLGRIVREGKSRGLLRLSPQTTDPRYYPEKARVEKELGRKISTEEFERDHYQEPEAGGYGDGTSIFDPVLCELAYRWFCPAGGSVLDPFAGGSVRGLVAGALGLTYCGLDISEEQLEENRRQASAFHWPWDGHVPPVWELMAAQRLGEQPATLWEPVDLLFSCPPYFDLEHYSEDPADLSNMDAAAFREAYRQIILEAGRQLRDDRFAVWVVGESRDSEGLYHGLVGLTVEAFAQAGLDYYNEASLITPVGSLAVRVGRIFGSSRKLGKSHQNVLVFVKGDPAAAAQACGEIEVPDLAAWAPEEEGGD